MDLGLLTRGAILGFTVAAAVGPISLLVIRRTLSAGLATGIASGLGVAVADGIYGGIAAFGLTAISAPLVALAGPLGIVGGVVLMAVGLRTVLAPPASSVAAPAVTRRGLVGAWASVLGLTLANPMTILLFVSIVVSMDVSASPHNAGVLTMGFFLGSLTWWMGLVSSVAALRDRITGRVLHRVTRASGLLIAGFGLLSVASEVRF